MLCSFKERGMDGTPGLNDTPPPWLVRLCHELWARLHGLWSIGVSLFGNLLAALLFIPISPFSQFTQFWAYQYKIAIIISLLVLLCFSLGIGFVSRFETTPSLYARRHHYLRQVILDHRSLKASGIPEIFFPPSIKLEEVFIPLQLINERTPVDYPLRAEEIPVWQRIFARRKKRPPRELLMERSGPGQNVEIAEFWQHCNREN